MSAPQRAFEQAMEARASPLKTRSIWGLPLDFTEKVPQATRPNVKPTKA